MAVKRLLGVFATQVFPVLAAACPDQQVHVIFDDMTDMCRGC
ncbi:hypothetical protein [Amycolatopsis sp. cmx-4-68]